MLMENWNFIVIGSGIAGLNFALNAAEKGKVLVITKKHVAESSTNYAQGGISAVLDQADSFERHVEDTLKAGSYHNDRDAVEFVVKNGPAAIKRLIEFGVEFDEEEGHIDLRLEGGHSAKRVVHVGDYTGKAIEEALVNRVKEHADIEVWEDAFAADLLVKNQICYGVQIIRNQGVENIFADATILATGGLGQIYKFTSNPVISTGDGFGMAKRAGCDFRDMEFMQFHPTAFAWQGRARFLLTESLRGEGAFLCREDGTPFMREYDQRGDLAPRDVVARCVYAESKRGKVYLKFPEEDKDLAEVKFPYVSRMLKDYGFDLGSDLIPVMPAAHFICGGVKTDLKGRTGIRNLFAFGEVAGTGVHGANRLGSNSLLEALVFSGEIVGQLKQHDQINSPIFDLPEYCNQQGDEIESWQLKIRQVMWDLVGIVRTGEALESGRQELEGLQVLIEQEIKKGVNEDLVVTLNMVNAGLLIVKAAIERKESLGGHFVD